MHDIRGCRFLFLIRYDHDNTEASIVESTQIFFSPFISSIKLIIHPFDFWFKYSSVFFLFSFFSGKSSSEEIMLQANMLNLSENGIDNIGMVGNLLGFLVGG